MQSFFNNFDSSKTTFKMDRNHISELNYFIETNTTIKQCIGILDRFLF